MNRTLLIVRSISLILLVACVGGCPSADVTMGPRGASFRNKRIAVVNNTPPNEDTIFDGITVVWDTTRGEELTSALERDLMSLGAYNVDDRQALDKILQEQDIRASTLVDPSTAARAGKMAGLDGIVLVKARGRFKLIFGIIMYIEKTATVRLLDVSTSNVVWSAELSLIDGSIVLPPSSTLFTSAEKRMSRALKDKLRKLIW